MLKPVYGQTEVVTVSGEDAFQAVERIAASLTGIPRKVAVAACLTAAITLERPDIASSEYAAVLLHASEVITGVKASDCVPAGGKVH